MLALSGKLDPTMGGPHPFPPKNQWNYTQHAPFTAVYETNRRSVYLMTQRLKRHPFLALFDGADTNASTPCRLPTTVPTQALFLMNDPFVHEQAGAFAARLLTAAGDEPARVRLAYAMALSRPPSPTEEQEVGLFLEKYRSRLKSTGVEVCRSEAAFLGGTGPEPVRPQRVPLCRMRPIPAMRFQPAAVSRRELFRHASGGFAALALAGILAEEGKAEERTAPASDPLIAAPPGRHRQSEAGHLPLHDRRRLARRYLRSQAAAARGPRQDDHGR